MLANRIIGAQSGDPYWSNVVALLHMDGTDGSTTFIDERGHTFTAAGNAQIDTAQSLFGGASGIFDGSGDFLSSPASTAWDISTGDWTIEMAVRWVAGANRGLMCRRSGGTNGWALNIRSDGSVVLRANIAGTWSDAWMPTAAGIVPTGTWTTIAFVRAGDIFRIFVGGTQASTMTKSGAIDNESSVALYIGTNNQSGEDYYNGWLDEVRFTKGVARYTANFTPPDAPFPAG